MPSHGFTMVELLIVVLLIGILAAIAIPQFADSTQGAREAALARSEAVLSDAISRYILEHDMPPGYPPGGGDPTEALFIKQLIYYTDAAGNVSDTKNPTKWPYGPYLRNGIPVNPFNNSSKVKLLDQGAAEKPKSLGSMTKAEITAIDAQAFGAEYGWLYCPKTGEIIANMDAKAGS
jgi:prepilin-type N-terminal cleavage/methylation domain-containing protein